MCKQWVATTVAILGLSAANAAGGEITARGSDSTLGLVKALAEAFQKASGTIIRLEGGGSGAGAEACMAGQVQLAFLSRDLKEEEKKGGLVGVAYAHDAVAVIVNPANPTNELTKAQLHDLFTGANGQWSDGKPVVLFNRNENSGTRECFQHAVLGKDAFGPKATVKHDAALLSTVAKVPTAVGYTSAGEVNNTVKVLNIDGVAPTPESIRSGKYPICRTLTLATKGAPSGDVKAFIDFVLSDQGQKIVADTGYVPIK
ncbi:MAG: phosphate ABC transporter substrate-binding protein [Planctomycetota bacterium]